MKDLPSVVFLGIHFFLLMGHQASPVSIMNQVHINPVDHDPFEILNTSILLEVRSYPGHKP